MGRYGRGEHVGGGHRVKSPARRDWIWIEEGLHCLPQGLHEEGCEVPRGQQQEWGVDDFKKNINGVMKDLLGSFKDLQFFTGESMDAEAMIAMCLYKDVNGEERPVLMFFKHGLEEEKC